MIRLPSLVSRSSLLATALFAAGTAQAATFTVTSPADTDGNSCGATCTLRQAINAANATPLPDTIRFAFAGVLTPATPLPVITGGLLIDGYSAPGAQANASSTGFDGIVKIRLSGSTIPGQFGLKVQSAQTVTVRGLSITDFSRSDVVTGRAIEAGGAGDVSVRGCLIGVTPAFAAAGNAIGVVVAPGQSGGVDIGGGGIANRNMIAANSIAGVRADAGNGAVNVTSNLFGTNAGGTTHLGAQGNAIAIARAGARVVDNTIKGSTTGVLVQAGDFQIVSNRIGVQAGDASPGTVGVDVGVRLQGNASGRGSIGGDGDLSNSLHCTLDCIEHGAAGIEVSAAQNRVTPPSGSGHLVLDLLGVDGFDTNDALDADSGPNGLLNAPLMMSARRLDVPGDTPVNISGVLDGLPQRSFRIAFYSGIGTPGDTGLTVNTDENGHADFGPVQVLFPGEAVAFVASSATLLDAVTAEPVATSEFTSRGVALDPPPVNIVVNSAADPGDGTCNVAECTLREAITLANGSGNAGTIDTIRFAIPGAGPHAITLGSALPTIAQPLTIDGYTQAGAVPNSDVSGVGSNAVLGIEVTGGGSAPFPPFAVFGSSAANVTLRGLSFTGFGVPPGPPMSFVGTGVRIEGCWFGVRPDGSERNTSFPLAFHSPGGTFGGAAPAQRNLWVNKRELDVAAGHVTNNLFGVLPDGRTGAVVSPTSDVLGNGNAAAVEVATTIEAVTVEGNVFSTPSQQALSAIVTRANANGFDSLILDNAFGESFDGATVLPLSRAVRASIRTRIASATHAIHGPAFEGVLIDSSNLSGVIRVEQRILGGGSGVTHTFGSHVLLRAPISATTGIGFDLNGDGVTENDLLPSPDADNGPNGLQNFPVLTSAVRENGQITVRGTLDTEPNQNHRIVLCGVVAVHASGHGGCDEVLETELARFTDATGHAEFDAVVTDDPAFVAITATAARIIVKNTDEMTSEFALNRTIEPGDRIFANGFE